MLTTSGKTELTISTDHGDEEGDEFHDNLNESRYVMRCVKLLVSYSHFS